MDRHYLGNIEIKDGSLIAMEANEECKRLEITIGFPSTTSGELPMLVSFAGDARKKKNKSNHKEPIKQMERLAWPKITKLLIWASSRPVIRCIPCRGRPSRSMELESAHGRWGSRDEPLYDHLGCQMRMCSMAKAGFGGCILGTTARNNWQAIWRVLSRTCCQKIGLRSGEIPSLFHARRLPKSLCRICRDTIICSPRSRADILSWSRTSSRKSFPSRRIPGLTDSSSRGQPG